MNDFSEKLKAARKAAGLTQQKMADRTEIPRRTIQDWEAGTMTPPPYVQRFVLNELESPRIVRCKDCVHYTASDYTESGHYCGIHSGGYEYMEVNPDDFCSYGKTPEA